MVTKNWSSIVSYAWEIFVLCERNRLLVNDMFSSYRRVTHVECEFRGFVGNGGNWRSI